MTNQPPPRVYIVTLPGEDLEAFATLAAATQHARDVCSHWDDHLDWSEVESFAAREADGKLHTSTVETPDGVLVLESCEVRV